MKKVSNGILPDKDIDKLILMDIERTITNPKSIHKEISINVLRAYALYNKEVGYCQGMNYVLNFLMYFTQEEGVLFGLLVGLIDKFSFQNLYGKGMPLLRTKFYQMDRLFHMYLPKLTEYFRFENISSELYGSGWFLTIFTQSLSEPGKAEKPSDLLISIWDSFLALGWKGVFKAGIYVLRKLEKDIINLKFGEIVKLISNVSSKEFWNNPTSALEFKDLSKKIKLANSILESFEIEFKGLFESI